MASINVELSEISWEKLLQKYQVEVVEATKRAVQSGHAVLLDNPNDESLAGLFLLEREMCVRLQVAANIKPVEMPKQYPPLVNVSEKLRDIWSRDLSSVKKEIVNQILLFLCNEDAVITEHQFGMVEETIDHAVAMFDQEIASVSEIEALNIPIDAFVGMNIANFIIVANMAHKK
jgi:hypothetical protein